MQFIGTHHQARRDWATKVIIVRGQGPADLRRRRKTLEHYFLRGYFSTQE